MTANLPIQHPDTAEGKHAYKEQARTWNQWHGSGDPDEQAPYPLTLGTRPCHSGKCWHCGHIGHQESACIAAMQLSEKEQQWCQIAGHIHSTFRPGPLQLHTGTVYYVSEPFNGTYNASGALVYFIEKEGQGKE